MVRSTVMSSAIIAGFKLWRKVRCHKGAVEKEWARVKTKKTFNTGATEEHSVEQRGGFGPRDFLALRSADALRFAKLASIFLCGMAGRGSFKASWTFARNHASCAAFCSSCLFITSRGLVPSWRV